MVELSQDVQLELQVRRYYEGLRGLSEGLRLMPGRKTVILFSEGYDQRIMDSSNTSFGSTRSDLIQGEFKNIDQASTGENALSQGHTLYYTYNDSLARINNANTSFYVIDSASLDSQYSRVDVFGQQSFSSQNSFESSRLDSLNSLASATGGRFYGNIKNFDKALTTINNDISNYYLIFYHSSNPEADGKFRSTRIKLRDDSFSVRSRDGYFGPKPFKKLNKDEKFIHLVEGLFLDNPFTEIEASYSLFYQPVSDDTIVGTAAIQISVDELRLDERRAALEIAGLVNDYSRETVDRFHRSIKLDKAARRIAEDGVLRLKVPFRMNPGYNKIKITVRDNTSGKRLILFDELTVDAVTSDTLSMSSLAFIPSDIVQTSTDKYDIAIEDVKSTMSSDFRVIDPLRLFSGRSVFPLIDHQFTVDSSPVLFFNVENFWLDDTTGAVDFSLEYMLIDKAGNEHEVPSVRDRIIPAIGTDRYTILSQLDFSGIPQGKYDFRVRFLDNKLRQGIVRASTVKIR
jgi:hypothetical protein